MRCPWCVWVALGLCWGRDCPSDRCCAPGCVAQKSAIWLLYQVPKSATAKTGVKIALWGSCFSCRMMAAASAPPRLPAVLALVAMFCELQYRQPVEPVYVRWTTCRYRLALAAHGRSLGVARLEGLACGSAPGESRARLGLARPDDRTGRSWAALLGEPWDSAVEFGP